MSRRPDPGHSCMDGHPSSRPSEWAYDGRGLELCRVCDLCRDQKLSRYRQEILEWYDQNDVNEAIEED